MYNIIPKIYSFHPNLFVMFEKSNFLREHHLLSCLIKMYKFTKVLQLNFFFKYLLVFFSNSFEIKVGV